MFFIGLLLTFGCIIPLTTAAFGTTNFAKIPLVDFCLADANTSDVIYYLFKSSAQTQAIGLTNDSYVLSSNDSRLPTKFLIHGYTSNVSTPWFKPLRKAYFKKGPHNVFYVDWTRAVRPNSYAVSSANILPVGENIADFIINLRVPLQNVHILGHSLGGQLAGFVGKHLLWKTGRRIARITAFDPAGPGFENGVTESRLNKHDADFVDVYHTDIGYFGALKPLGHVDFYVNGGINQPGCPRGHDTDENCHHKRSAFYFIESINSKPVMAKPAELTEQEQVVVTGRGEYVVFGDPVNTTSRGVYSIQTNAAPPYLKTP